MFENIPPDVHDIYKKILVLVLSVLALLAVHMIFPEFFQCHCPECQRNHIGEP